MNIQLIDSQVIELFFGESNDDSQEIEFSFGQAFSEKEEDSFSIIFELKLRIDNGKLLAVKYTSQFKADQKIENTESRFFSVNAPAIAYPFLRAYVANLMLASGYNPLILPTINFVKLQEGRTGEKASN